LFCTDILQKRRKSYELWYYFFAKSIRKVHTDFKELVCNLTFGTVSELPKSNIIFFVNKNVSKVKISMHQNKFGLKPSFKIEILHSIHQQTKDVMQLHEVYLLEVISFCRYLIL
jgi:hypothetical protein